MLKNKYKRIFTNRIFHQVLEMKNKQQQLLELTFRFVFEVIVFLFYVSDNLLAMKNN